MITLAVIVKVVPSGPLVGITLREVLADGGLVVPPVRKRCVLPMLADLMESKAGLALTREGRTDVARALTPKKTVQATAQQQRTERI